MKNDWGWRSLHGSVQLGKQVVEAYYGTRIKYSYYNGCSNGGRQGLKEIQTSPDSFDGVVIGAPGWYASHLNPWFTRVGINNLPYRSDQHIGYRLFKAMGDLVIRQCDLLDGVEDGIISMPDACEPDYTEMLCSVPGIDQSACLTEEQAEVPQMVYDDFKSVTGTTLYPGLSPGCEGQWQAVLSLSTTSPFGWGYIRYFLLDSPHWNWRSWTDGLVNYAQLTDPGECTAGDFNLTDFKSLGNKAIMYHGLADGLIPPKGSDLYYNSVMEEMGESLAEMQSWFRYFQIPGMQHCWCTPTAPDGAPWNIGGEFQATKLGTDEWSVPGFRDKRHDVLMALMDWVENGNPVDSIIATAWNSVWDASSGVRSQRPLCPYPQMAIWDGVGDVDAATSWSCG
jgi:feruloyl esterase